MASTSIPHDMEFIYMALRAPRPDGKPPVPIWVTTEENVVCVRIKAKLLPFALYLSVKYPLFYAFIFNNFSTKCR